MNISLLVAFAEISNLTKNVYDDRRTWWILGEVDPRIVEAGGVVVSGLEYLLPVQAHGLPILVLALTDEAGVQLLHPQLRDVLDHAPLLLPALDQELVQVLAALSALLALLESPELQQVVNHSTVD